jgi:prophage regulatory protein
MNLEDVCRVTKLGKTTIKNLIKEGRFPSSRSLTGRRKIWLESDVRGWIYNTVGAPDSKWKASSEGWLSAFTGRGDSS